MELILKDLLSIRTILEDTCFNRDSMYELLDFWITTYKKLEDVASLSSTHGIHTARKHGAHGQACAVPVID